MALREGTPSALHISMVLTAYQDEDLQKDFWNPTNVPPGNTEKINGLLR